MDISKIKPYEKNAKVHPKKQIEQVANSIKEFGFNQPIVLDKNNVIIVGHGRYEAAKLLGLDDVPTITVDLTEEQAKAYRLADNKLNESEWDMKLAVDELKELSEEMQELTGFDLDLLIEPDEKDDEIPEDAPPVAKLGDLWALGRHRLLVGDATKSEDIERLMGGNKANMCFTDPPYNVNYEGTAGKIQNDKMSDVAFDVFLTESLTNILNKTDGAIYICMSSSEMGSLQDAFKKSGGHWSTFIIWAKNTFTMGRSDYQRQYEPMLYGWREGAKGKYWCGARNQGDVWNFNKPFNSKLHPTMKPVELVVKAITNSSEINSIVLDTFLGSGTTMIAADKTDRICYGMELDPKYADVIIKRWEDYTGFKAEKL
jgi:DNA modification methylase